MYVVSVFAFATKTQVRVDCCRFVVMYALFPSFLPSTSISSLFLFCLHLFSTALFSFLGLWAFGGLTDYSFGLVRFSSEGRPSILAGRRDVCASNSHVSLVQQNQLAHFNDIICQKWIVVTSIYAPSPTVEDFAALSSTGWCLVIIGDTKGPPDGSFDRLLKVWSVVCLVFLFFVCYPLSLAVLSIFLGIADCSVAMHVELHDYSVSSLSPLWAEEYWILVGDSARSTTHL